MRNKQEIVDAARAWLGVKWRHQGRARSGVDCAGLVVVVARDLGLNPSDVTGYSRRPTRFNFLDYFAAQLERVPIDQMRAGDVLVFRQDNYPCHCGIVGEKNDRLTLIHAYLPRKAVYEEPIFTDNQEVARKNDWSSRLVAVFRFDGFA